MIYDINAYKYGERKKLERVVKWIVPCLTVILQILTLGYGLGWELDIRKCVAVIVGIMFVVTGNYLPKFEYIKNQDADTCKAKKINRFIGYETVIMGVLFIVSALLPPITTIACLLLLIPYAVISVVYGIRVGREK